MGTSGAVRAIHNANILNQTPRKNPLPEKQHQLTFLNNLQICVNLSNKVVLQAKVSRFNIVGHQCCAEIPLAL